MSIQQALPTALGADGTSGVLPSRTGLYGEAYVNSVGADQGLYAAEGSCLTVGNATPGTGVTGNAAPVASTSLLPFFHIFNGGTKTIYPKHIWVRVGTAPSAGATTTNFLSWSDTGNGATTWSSGGVTMTPVNTNTGSTFTGGGIYRIGALVIVGVAPRRLWHVQARSVISVIQDMYYITFGNPAQGQVTANITSGTLVASGHIAMPPVAIAPLTNWSLSIDGLSQSGAGAYELSACVVER